VPTDERSHSRVEPSTSANSSVTVPVGKSPLTPRSLQSTNGPSARGSISLMLASMQPPGRQNISENAHIAARRMRIYDPSTDLPIVAHDLSLPAPDSRLDADSRNPSVLPISSHWIR
jgi:hypothetical protein